MKRVLLNAPPDGLPSDIQAFAVGAPLYDSSCSPEARVYFIDKENGFFLKIAAAGTLKREAQMTAYFHKKGLGPQVCQYISADRDYMVTQRVLGEDGIYSAYLEQPQRLCDTFAERLRMLHEMSYDDCPVQDRVAEYIALAENNYHTGNFDKTAFPDSFGYKSAAEAYAVLQAGKASLQNDVLIHGDYCLPNILLDNWQWSGFIDVGNGGVGDRHIDLFWGIWTLWFNLKTNRYATRFLNVYGRDAVNTDTLKIIAAAEVFG